MTVRREGEEGSKESEWTVLLSSLFSFIPNSLLSLERRIGFP
jgi:hypothetical protein